MNDDINKLHKRVVALIAEIRQLDEFKDAIIGMKQERYDELEKIREQVNKLKSVERKRGKIYD